MEDTTIISYSHARTDSLLSLTESRSRYLLPFGGRFRVVDFTIQNAVYSGARKTIIYNDIEDNLDEYVKHYGAFGDQNFPSLKVISRKFSDIRFCYNLILDTNTAYYIIYNGDNPSIIDFVKIVNKFKKKNARAALFKLKVDGQATMAHTILVTRQKYLLDVINVSIDDDHTSPNLFEMIINIMINKGIKKESIDAYYWPMKTVPDYYYLNMAILKNPILSSIVFHKSPIKSFIGRKGQASVGKNAKIANSIITDDCKINGTVTNSIIFPGVEIGADSYIKNSIILPNVIIGSGSYITKTIIDEQYKFTDNMEYNNYLNIGNHCNIGIEDEQIKNNEFTSLNNSITLIGKNCRIPDGSRIGGACYIASDRGESYFQKNKHLYNGLSIVN